MDASARLSIAGDGFNRSLRRRRLQSGVPKTAGGTTQTGVDLLQKSGEFPMSYEELDDTAAPVYEGIRGGSGPLGANQRSHAARGRGSMEQPRRIEDLSRAPAASQ